MPKVKFYAIKGPEGGRIVDTWGECEKLTHGVKGVLFKSFSSREEAQAWIDGLTAPVPKGLRVYVDGSFTPGYPKAGWGFVVVDGDEEIAHASGHTAFDAESRNIDGEVMASYQAMKWLHEHDKNAVICHDYEGVARWAKGEWQAKSSIAKQYVSAIKPYVHRASFEKVAAHTGVKWNEFVDKLAKDAIAKARELEETEKFLNTDLEDDLKKIKASEKKPKCAPKKCAKKPDSKETLKEASKETPKDASEETLKEPLNAPLPKTSKKQNDADLSLQESLF